MVTTRKEVKHESVRIKRIVLDLHGVIVNSRMVVLFEYELQYSFNCYTLLYYCIKPGAKMNFSFLTTPMFLAFCLLTTMYLAQFRGIP